jgi:hypothetical protein
MTTSNNIHQQSDLEHYFRNNHKRLIHKWNHYFDIYERHFHRYRNKEVVILEIGLFQGGSLQMWKNYFGDKVKIYGIDIDPRCKAYEEENVKIFIGSQSDRQFLRSVKQEIGPVDIIIDDGGHKMKQQIISFEELFDIVKIDGLYLCEDLHTSYWLEYGGGHKRRGTFIEYSKNFIDALNAYHSRQSSLKVTEFTKTVGSLHYYDSVVVIEKREVKPLRDEKTGIPTFEDVPDTPGALISLYKSFKTITLTIINLILRWMRLPGFIWR